jgi:3',5'-cyclic AMP phosphodiesterase CpdA
MKRVLHLSDLHFGRVRPELLEPLVETVNRLAPDLVAISGDLTQRARHSQFREARAFIDRLRPPVLAVPGNHDAPLDNLPVRLLDPWARWRRHIGPELEPELRLGELSAVGVNTADPLSWQRGRIRRRAVSRVCRTLSEESARLRVVVLHHPFIHREGEGKAVMRGAAAALGRLAACGADVALSGHLHSWRAEAWLGERGAAAGVLLVEAGTGLSTRQRDEPNDFNLLTLAPDRADVERWAARPDGSAFDRLSLSRFRREGGSWMSV